MVDSAHERGRALLRLPDLRVSRRLRQACDGRRDRSSKRRLGNGPWLVPYPLLALGKITRTCPALPDARRPTPDARMSGSAVLL